MRTIVFDTETTGLPLLPSSPLSRQPHIIEFAAVAIQNGRIVEEFETKIDPRQPLTAEITKITGLTDADLVGAPTFSEALRMIREAFKGAKLMIAHNLPFDREMIMFELRRLENARLDAIESGVFNSELAVESYLDLFDGIEAACTSDYFKDKLGRGIKLKDLFALKLDRPFEQKHRALDDALALAEIVIKERIWEKYA